MLILARKTGEKIIIGNDITITILGLSDSHVRLGIGAPRDVGVYREEVYRRICIENQLAAEETIRKSLQIQEEG